MALRFFPPLPCVFFFRRALYLVLVLGFSLSRGEGSARHFSFVPCSHQESCILIVREILPFQEWTIDAPYALFYVFTFTFWLTCSIVFVHHTADLTEI